MNRKVRAPRPVSASGAPHIVTWTKQTWIKRQCTIFYLNFKLKSCCIIFNKITFLTLLNKINIIRALSSLFVLSQRNWRTCRFLQSLYLSNTIKLRSVCDLFRRSPVSSIFFPAISGFLAPTQERLVSCPKPGDDCASNSTTTTGTVGGGARVHGL